MEKYPLQDSWQEKHEKVPVTWTAELTDKILTDPYRYLHAKPGKDIRTQMIASFNVWLHVPDVALEIITRVVEMLHTSSLLYSPLPWSQAKGNLGSMMWKMGRR